MTPVEALKDEPYVSLETYRKDGTAVSTPVWIGELEGKLVVWTDGTSYKVARLRHNPRARLAACNARGKVRGEWFDVTAEVWESVEAFQRVDAVIARKYGIQRMLITTLSRLRGRWGKFVGIALTPAASSRAA